MLFPPSLTETEIGYIRHIHLEREAGTIPAKITHGPALRDYLLALADGDFIGD
jgi:hypothetical protein